MAYNIEGRSKSGYWYYYGSENNKDDAIGTAKMISVEKPGMLVHVTDTETGEVVFDITVQVS